MSSERRIPGGVLPVDPGAAAARRGTVSRKVNEVKYLSKAVAVTAVAGGLAAAGSGVAAAHSGAVGGGLNSPGVVSGNTVQAPVNVPVNVNGNSVNVVGLLNPAFGNVSINP